MRKNQAAGGATDVCDTPEENAKVMVGSLEHTFSRMGDFDKDMVNSVPLRPAKPWLNNFFTDNEVSAAIHKMPNGKSAGPAEYYKALEGDPGTKVLIREVMKANWESGSFPTDAISNGPPTADNGFGDNT